MAALPALPVPSTPPIPDLAQRPPLSSRGWRLAAGFGLVTLLAVIHAVHDLSHGFPPWLGAFTGAMVVAQCVALTLLHDLTSGWRRHRQVMWLVGPLLCAAFGQLIVWPHSDRLHSSPTFLGAGGVVVGLGVGAVWLFVFMAPRLVERARLQGQEVENLRREAELARLRVHLHPHFLLNTLNAVAGLVSEEPGEARRLLAALGDLVRDALSGGDEPQPFGVEAAWLRRYAEILEVRHRGLLAFRWELGAETLAAPVPRLLLQPLVENAVKHGALRRREGGTVLVRSEVRPGGALRFTVEDDGPGLRPERAAESGEGLGIGLVRRRLALACPGGTLRYEPVPVGTRAVVELPAAEGRP
jgi:signal transduction histidine kinase